jgi:diacylglycerol kinase (ATP)
MKNAKSLQMNKRENFSVTERMKSILPAINGFRTAVTSEHNLWVHAVATISVAIIACLLKVSGTEAGMLCLTIGLVWCAELINTAIEKAMDFISMEKQPVIKLIKDTAAAAVLVAAITAVLTGCFIFIPKL